jgi:plastocyanin
MRNRTVSVFFAAVMLATAGDISGTIAIGRKITHYKVTASGGLYERGTVIPLGANPENDPISFERSHVAVYLEAPAEGSDTAGSGPPEAVIEQKDRRFVPDLVVVPVGATVSFPNLDPIFHNIFSLSGSKSFDLGNYPQGETRRVTFSHPGVVSVYCHLHPNMEASVVVTPNRWGTRVAPDGTFMLRNIPKGSYTVVAWHRTAGIFRKKLDVAEQGDARISFVIPYVAPPDSGNTTAHR